LWGGGVKALGSEAPVAGSGFYLGKAGDGTSYMYVAPKSTEVPHQWGSNGTTRGTVSTTDGLANTNILAGFGNSITTGHPAAYYAKNLTTGGYNTWYLPARNELTTMFSNQSATPFATNDSLLAGAYYRSSTESTGFWAWIRGPGAELGSYVPKTNAGYRVRAVRRSTM
jgi:hypothetical protein